MTMSATSLVDLTVDHPIVEEIMNLVATQSDPEAELCGVILPTPYRGNQVFSIPNRAKDTHSSYVMSGSDIRLTVEGWLEEADTTLWREVVFWHTHPGGGIGPSRIDMQNRPPSGYNLVIALTTSGPVLTFY